MAINTRYPVVCHTGYGYHEPECLVAACEAHPVLGPMVDRERLYMLGDIPRHHPDFVKVVIQLIEEGRYGHLDWEVVLIDYPLYDVTNDDGKESINCASDLTWNAAEFLDVPQGPYQLVFSGFRLDQAYIETQYEHPEAGTLRLWLNVVATERLNLHHWYRVGEMYTELEKLVTYHQLGKLLSFEGFPSIFEPSPKEDPDLLCIVGERWFKREALIGQPDTFVYIPE